MPDLEFDKVIIFIELTKHFFKMYIKLKLQIQMMNLNPKNCIFITKFKHVR